MGSAAESRTIDPDGDGPEVVQRATAGTTPPWEPSIDDRSITMERMEAVAFTPMGPRLRNHLITQAYGDLADAMARLYGTTDITWAGLGVWASDTIGGYLGWSVPVLGRMITRAFADGNRDVFADVSRTHVMFLETVGQAYQCGRPLAPAWDECAAMLGRTLAEPAGTPRAAAPDPFWDRTDDDPFPEDGIHNRILILGYRCYLEALETDDPQERSARILAGNMLLALHEQRKLSFAISVGFRGWLRALTTWRKPFETWRQWSLREPRPWQLRLENRWIGFATRKIIGVRTPQRRIRVGRPVPTGQNPLPPLAAIDLGPSESGSELPPEALAARALAARLARTLAINGRPAGCWNDLVDRVAYICAVFEQFQREPGWFDADGRVVRPRPRTFVATALRRQRRRLADSPSYPPEEPPIEIPIDSDLDELRQLASYPVTPIPSLLSFASLRNPDTASGLREAFEEDCLERLALATCPGGLLDPAQCLLARSMFKEWRIVVLMGLVFRSLPEAYASADGVRVIGEISALATDPFRRAGETATFIGELLYSAEGWRDGRIDPDDPVLAGIIGVRTMHGMVAGQLERAGWDSETFGVPVNAEDVVGTALSFVVPVFELMTHLGIEPTPDVADAYTSFWLGIGYLLGAPLEAVTVLDDGRRRPLRHHEAVAVAGRIRQRHRRRSLDGVRLTEALIEGIGDGLPHSFDYLATGFLTALGDPFVTRLLLAPEGRGRTRSWLAAAVLRGGLRFRPTRPVTRWTLQRVGGRWLQPFLDAGRGRPYRHPPSAPIAHRDPLVSVEQFRLWPLGCATDAVAPSRSADRSAR